MNQPCASGPCVTTTVLIITYNHERFIAEAIESVLAQETDFEYEIVISEDCSTDSTREIVQDFARRFPGQIRLVLSERNQNNNEVLARGLRIARGRYIALFDGDDYWTSPHKLQKQVDFLDLHRECSICFHNVNVVYDSDPTAQHPFFMGEPRVPVAKPMPKPISTLSDIAAENFIPTCSVMFRAGLFSDVPVWYKDLAFGDWPLHVLNAEHGDIGYLDETLATYRIHSGGYWSNNLRFYRTIQELEQIIEAYETINRYVDRGRRRRFHKNVVKFHYHAARLLCEADDYKRARGHARICFLGACIPDSPRRIPMLLITLRAYFPRLYRRAREVRSRFARRFFAASS